MITGVTAVHFQIQCFDVIDYSDLPYLVTVEMKSGEQLKTTEILKVHL